MQGLRLRGVGGRGTGPRDGANFAIFVVSNAYKKKSPTGAGLVEGGGARARGGCKGFGCGGVGGRGTGPRDGANFAMCVVVLLFLTRTKKKKNGFF